MTNPFEQVSEFHRVFHPVKCQKPTAFASQEAADRVAFIIEELIEFLYAAQDSEHDFAELTEQAHRSIEQAVAKITNKRQQLNSSRDPLVDQVDALTDALYLTYGSFALLGVNPTTIFELVHRANMGKLFPDGKPHCDPVTGKIMKPDDWEEKYAPESAIRAELQRQTCAAKETAPNSDPF